MKYWESFIAIHNDTEKKLELLGSIQLCQDFLPYLDLLLVNIYFDLQII